MGRLINRIAGSSEDRAAHREAKAELDRIARRDREETADFREANARVAETSRRLPWLTRG